MNREKAKTILQNYRPGGQDREDAQFAEALAMVEKDPALKQWFQEQQRFDAALSASLQNVAVPADLQAKLLTEVREVRSGAVAPEQSAKDWWSKFSKRLQQVLAYPILDLRKANAKPTPLWRSRPILGIAGGLAVLALLAIYWNTRPTTFTTLCQEVTENAWGTSPHLQLYSGKISEVRAWLANHDVHTKIDIPAVLQNTPLRGCSIVEWHGQKIPALCIMEGACHMHLLVIDKPKLAAIPLENEPEMLDFGLLRTASWSNKDRIYVLTGMNVHTFVKKFRRAGQWHFAS